jgi:DNA modification methylase
MSAECILGNNLDVLKTFKDNIIDSIITDPPYGLKFMGKKWDYDVPAQEVWEECLRVLKPGGHLLSFFGTRTYHRGVIKIEDAGFEIRDQCGWMYGNGFPKGINISKAIDKKEGAERVLISGTPKPSEYAGKFDQRSSKDREVYGNPVTPNAQLYDGWNTTLKPAWEPIVLARKPIEEDTIVDNVLKYGTGGLNIDACRIGTADDMNPNDFDDSKRTAPKFSGILNGGNDGQFLSRIGEVPNGRWPANIIHDGSDEVLALFPESKGQLGKSTDSQRSQNNCYGTTSDNNKEYVPRNDSGSAARFFYCAKASKKDRDEGCSNLPLTKCGLMEDDNYPIKTGSGNLRNTQRHNIHPTVKPTNLMRYLCKLITPPGGTILDHYMGSGSTGKAAILEGFNFIGIENELEYYNIAMMRTNNVY